ncbi:MAG TPA: DUF692 family protein [Myxococcaceae bacterium]|nr:DUF692 family protein [Myxococcaceae bacterium]
MTTVQVGFVLQPDEEMLGLTEPLLELADYLEVAPETTWFETADGRLLENGFHRRFLQIGDRTGKPFVAHGVGLSLGSFGRAEWRRRARWLRRLREDQARFQYRWYTDHLGATVMGGRAVALPVALPMTPELAAQVRRVLRAAQAVVPDVGMENTAPTVLFGHPLEEPGFIAAALARPRTHLLLDLHNLHTVAVNFGVDPDAYLARLDLAKVIEIHVAGGSWSDPAWLPGGRSLRLDSHDGAAPDEVLALLEKVAPRCPNLRGITLERMEGTVGAPDVAALAAELRHLRDVARSLRRSGQAPVPRDSVSAPLGTRRETDEQGTPCEANERGDAENGGAFPREENMRAGAAELEQLQRDLSDALRAEDPVASIRALSEASGLLPSLRASLLAADPDGLRLTALLIAKLRFERVIRGSSAAGAWFDRDPAAFSAAFRRYHAAVPPSESFPAAEARSFLAWAAAHQEDAPKSTRSLR